MRFDNKDELMEKGFTGFISISELQQSKCREAPSSRGVYLVVHPDASIPQFSRNSSGGFFKGRNPVVAIPTLRENWVNGSIVLYIGKAGSLAGSATLRSRLNQYMEFGQGKPIGHWGGRYIWQIPDSGTLKVCWKVTSNEVPRTVERQLIQDFFNRYQQRPFANLRN